MVGGRDGGMEGWREGGMEGGIAKEKREGTRSMYIHSSVKFLPLAA